MNLLKRKYRLKLKVSISEKTMEKNYVAGIVSDITLGFLVVEKTVCV